MSIINMSMLPLLVTISASFHIDGPCTQAQIAEDLDYCASSLILGYPWESPKKICCEQIQKNKMTCICQSVTKVFYQYFDVNKLPQLSRACGNILIPGSYCGRKCHYTRPHVFHQFYFSSNSNYC